MDTQRLFLALPLPDPVRGVLANLITRLPAVRWTPVEQLHITLRFLGDVETRLIDPLIERLGQIRVEPFIVPLEGVGAFPPKAPPRVLWVGLGSGHPLLHQLRQRVDDAVLATGVDADLRMFHPHVTLARCADANRLAANGWLKAHREFAGPAFRVEAFDLCASELQASGAVHSLVARFALTPRRSDVVHPA